ncbi:MAG: HEAT repeat domain-containing protein [Gemmataceae bacterium]|nr:HEAT repeat domain-containing protein [Gemmataceae bacterium]
MSIAVLNQVYDEARRLAVAGSVIAAGDFRLKKLIPPLEQAGAKAPVFAKVAEAAKAVVEGPEEKGAENLLELTSLVTAVLYTQGETGLAGELQPIETVNLSGTLAQTPARVLKPLLEALSSTGSGRLELVKEAHQQGEFRDLRLVKPALNGLDDPYAEVADFLAEKVLPLYGAAALPELRGKYNPAGAKGDPRRLKLMHALDPAGTKELVKQALDPAHKEVSKEVKVAAIGLLGPEDLDFLIEQAGVKAQDVRGAAYRALAKIDDPKAVAVLEKALAGKDADAVAREIEEGRVPRHVEVLAAELRSGVDALLKLKDKKAAGQAAYRLVMLVNCLPAGSFPAADAVLLDLFARRAELAKVKGDHHSGSDVAETAIDAMAQASPAVAAVLADAHAAVGAVNLDDAFRAARRVPTPAAVYDRFAPYLTDPAAAKKGTNPARDKQEAIVGELNGRYITWFSRSAPDPDDEDADADDAARDGPPPDPRWLDLAVKMKHLGLVDALHEPGRPHPAAQAFAKAAFDEAFAKAKSQDQVQDPLSVLVHVGHPDAAAALAASYERTIGKANANTYWYYYLIPHLPKEAAPVLEAVIPKVKDPKEADRFAEAIQELKEKK